MSEEEDFKPPDAGIADADAAAATAPETTDTSATAPAVRPAPPWLVSRHAVRVQVFRGLRQVAEISPASAEIRIGRGPDNDLVLNDPSVSRDHCRLRFTLTGVFLEDNSSTSGTLLNDVRVSSAVIPRDAVLTVGALTLRLVARPRVPIPIVIDRPAMPRIDAAGQPYQLLGDEETLSPTIWLLLNDPDEGRYLDPFVGNQPVSAEQRAAYRRFLLEQRDVRGEVLTLSEALVAHPPPADAANQRARLATLLHQVDPHWWRIMRHAIYLLNCGLAHAHPRAVRFAFACPRAWEELTATDHRDRRHCTTCNQDVHRANTLTRAQTLALDGHCLAVPTTLAETTAYPTGRATLAGRPEHPILLWARQLFADLPDRPGN